MHKMTRAFVLMAISLTLSACFAYTAMPNLNGVVVDSATGRPIAGATIEVRGRDENEAIVTTDTDGNFSIPGVIHFSAYPHILPNLPVRVRAPGYQTQELDGTYRYDEPRTTIRLVPGSP